MEYLNHHIGEAFAPRIQTQTLKASLARAALQHVPGSEELIRKTFEPQSVPKEIQPNKIQNLVMHTGHIMN
jgi:hypothetical protein